MEIFTYSKGKWTVKRFQILTLAPLLLPPPPLSSSLSLHTCISFPVQLSTCKRLGCICILINRLKTVFEKPKYDFFILTTYTNIEIY